MRILLQELGHKQRTKPIYGDNVTAAVIANDTIKKQ